MASKDNMFGSAFDLVEETQPKQFTNEQKESSRKDFDRVVKEIIKPLMEKYGQMATDYGHKYKINDTTAYSDPSIEVEFEVKTEVYSAKLHRPNFKFDLEVDICQVKINGLITMPTWSTDRVSMPAMSILPEQITLKLVEPLLKQLVDQMNHLTKGGKIYEVEKDLLR